MTIHRNVPDFSTNITTESPKIQLAKQRSRIDRYQTKLLTATPPFTDENQVSIYYKILNSPPPPFPETLAISPEMKAIVLKCLEKDPEKRYQNARELRKALSALV